jgi:hypothetical protein
MKDSREQVKKWLAEQDGPLRTILGELMLIGCTLEYADLLGVVIKLRGPGLYDVATLYKRTRYWGETKHVPYYEISRPEIGWTSGLHKDPVDAVQKYIDKWWRE